MSDYKKAFENLSCGGCGSDGLDNSEKPLGMTVEDAIFEFGSIETQGFVQGLKDMLDEDDLSGLDSEDEDEF
jgi:hypothetical protein